MQKEILLNLLKSTAEKTDEYGKLQFKEPFEKSFCKFL